MDVDTCYDVCNIVSTDSLLHAREGNTCKHDNCTFFFCLFAISWAAPAAYGVSQARGLIRVVATGLCQSHSNAGSEPRLQPTPQLTATPDP